MPMASQTNINVILIKKHSCRSEDALAQQKKRDTGKKVEVTEVKDGRKKNR
jgi:hypothetical protein